MPSARFRVLKIPFIKKNREHLQNENVKETLSANLEKFKKIKK